MAPAKSRQELAAAIEDLVDEYMAEVRRDAEVALQAAFARQSRGAVAKPKKRPAALAATSTNGAPRRSPAELGTICERLYEQACAHPGESMTVFAEALGISVRDLNRPMSKLKADGRVRRVGERNLTRYFPAAGRRSRGSET